jgi:hypothetical protein
MFIAEEYMISLLWYLRFGSTCEIVTSFLASGAGENGTEVSDEVRKKEIERKWREGERTRSLLNIESLRKAKATW